VTAAPPTHAGGHGRRQFACTFEIVEFWRPAARHPLPNRTTQQPNLHEHSPDPRKESRKRKFGFFGELWGPGGESSEA
jgi:hypothetical protein